MEYISEQQVERVFGRSEEVGITVWRSLTI